MPAYFAVLLAVAHQQQEGGRLSMKTPPREDRQQKDGQQGCRPAQRTSYPPPAVVSPQTFCSSCSSFSFSFSCSSWPAVV